MNALTPLGLYSPFMIYGILSLVMTGVMFRMALMRNRNPSALDVTVLSAYQWGCMGMACFFHILADASELSLGFLMIKDPGIPDDMVSWFLGLSFLSLFEAGRAYFSKRIGVWIYLPFFAVAGYAFTLGDEEFRAAVKLFIALPGCILLSLAVLLRLRKLTLYCGQLRFAAYLLAFYGIYYGFLIPPLKDFSFTELSLEAISMDSGIPLQLIGAVIMAVIAGLVLDHYFLSRDAFLNFLKNTERSRLRRLILIFSGLILISGAVFSDSMAIRSLHKIFYSVEQAGEAVAKRVSESNQKITGKHFGFIMESHPYITGVRVFLPADKQWVYRDKEGHLNRNSRYNDSLNQVAMSGRPLMILHDQAESAEDDSSFLMPIFERGTREVSAVLSLRLPHWIPQEAMNSQRVGFFSITLLICGGILMLWLLYTGSQERHFLFHEILQQFKRLFEGNPMIGMILDPARGMIMEANVAAEQFLAYPPGGLNHKSFSEIKLTASGDEENRLFRYPLANGEQRTLKMFSAPLIFRGKPMRLCFWVDQTESLRTESHLQKKLEQMTALFNALPTPAYWLGSDGRYRGFNQAFADRLPIPKAEIPGFRAVDLSEDPYTALPTAGIEGVPDTGIKSELLLLSNQTVIHTRCHFPYQQDRTAVLGVLTDCPPPPVIVQPLNSKGDSDA